MPAGPTSSIIPALNSFVQFYAIPPANEEPCLDSVPFCLPVESFDDVFVSMIVTSSESCPTIDVKLKDSGGTLHDMGNLGCYGISSAHVGGTSFWLQVNSNCCDLALLIARLNHDYSSYGTWSLDPMTGNIQCTGDIHLFAEALTGVVYSAVCTCYLKITAPDSPDMGSIQTYLQTNYPEYGIWTIDPDIGGHGNAFICTGSICDFPPAGALPEDISYSIITSATCELDITAFACLDTDLVDWLNDNYSSYGTWSIDGDGHIVATDDISAFEGAIPCVDYIIQNDGSLVYTNFISGKLGLDDTPVSDFVSKGKCFTYIITLDGVTYESNCFIYTPSDCYTTRIRYRSDQNVFGFIYFIDNGSGGNQIPDFYNTVRLPLYKRYPLPRSTETSYRKSDGNYITLSSIMEKVWQVQVDWLDDDNHFKLFVALGNNDFEMYDEVKDVWVQYQKDGDYVPAWDTTPGINLNAAPCMFNLKEMPFANFNTNCN